MIINTTTGNIVSHKEKLCDTWFSQARGLMFSTKKNAWLRFKKSRRISLHNWFVFYALTLIFLDESHHVVEIRKKFYPFTFYTSKTKATSVLEIPYKDREVPAKVGDKLLVKPVK